MSLVANHTIEGPSDLAWIIVMALVSSTRPLQAQGRVAVHCMQRSTHSGALNGTAISLAVPAASAGVMCLLLERPEAIGGGTIRGTQATVPNGQAV